MKKQDFKVLKTKDLYPFPDNPFHVAEDETLSELAESIKEFGIVTPIITRPKEDGNGYEVIAGQRRVAHISAEDETLGRGPARRLERQIGRASCRERV